MTPGKARLKSNGKWIIASDGKWKICTCCSSTPLNEGLGYILSFDSVQPLCIAASGSASRIFDNTWMGEISGVTLYIPAVILSANLSPNSNRSASADYFPGGSSTTNFYGSSTTCGGSITSVYNSTSNNYFSAEINAGQNGVNGRAVSEVNGTVFYQTTSTYSTVSQTRSNDLPTLFPLTAMGQLGTCSIRCVCALISLSPTSFSLSSGATSRTLTITAAAGANGNAEWVAAPSFSNGRAVLGPGMAAAESIGEASYFLAITSAALGNGSGTLTFSATANTTGSSRTGYINVNGILCTVTQSG